MQKQTKIIATIGPSTDSEEKIEELIGLGVNVFRFNFKHSDLEWHSERIDRVKRIAKKLNSSIATLLDLQGPEVRLSLPFDKIVIEIGEKVLVSKALGISEKGISFNPPDIISSLRQGQKVSADDGLFQFIVRIENGKTYLQSLSSGILLNKKTINIANLDFDFPVLHDGDRIGLKLAKEKEIDFVALSFVRSTKDIAYLKKEMKKLNLKASIVAKIETPKAILDIENIVAQSDVIMIARGDLGVELSLEEVPFYQKQIIRDCIQKGIPVITATQMLESMTQRPIPTRAEVSDVANAVYDFTDSVMLSGETASGKYPIQAVSIMTKVVSYSENKNRVPDIRNVFSYELSDTSQMVCDSAFNLYKVLKIKKETVKGFLIFTESGKTARMLSRYRPHVPIFAFCPKDDLVRKLSLSYGVMPIYQDSLDKKSEITKSDIEKALTKIKDANLCKKGDNFIALHGDHWTSKSGTSTIRVVTA
ncbi:MAG: pyruvate kinase [Candidatus Levybacteria bacterium]|nr:pyruvate kinase [Candidatus Levybacteria bacterium]